LTCFKRKRLKAEAIPTLFPDSVVHVKNRTDSKANQLDSAKSALNIYRKRIVELEDQIKQMKALENQKQKELRELKPKYTHLRQSVNRFLTDNQIEYLLYGNINTFQFSEETIKRSLDIYQKTGKKNYEYIRKLGFPFPSYTALMKRLKDMTFAAGIQPELAQNSTKSMTEVNNDLSPQLDETQINPILYNSLITSNDKTVQQKDDSNSGNIYKIISFKLFFLIIIVL
jgi:chromosome segregation ATPase